MKVRKKWLAANKNSFGAYTERQMSILGLAIPLPDNWAKDILGTELSDSQKEEFEAEGERQIKTARGLVAKMPRARKKRKVRRRKKDSFYDSREWRELRYRVLKKYGYSCMACGRSTKEHKVVMHVDHIKPRSKRPDLELHETNLQVLCEDCNLGKSNKSQDDLRPERV